MPAGQQIRCSVSECTWWGNGDECTKEEIMIQRQPAKGMSMSTDVQAEQEQDTFCSSFDPKAS